MQVKLKAIIWTGFKVLCFSLKIGKTRNCNVLWCNAQSDCSVETEAQHPARASCCHFLNPFHSREANQVCNYFGSHLVAGCLHFKMNHWPPTPLQLDVWGVHSFQRTILLCSSLLGGRFIWTRWAYAGSWCCPV